MKTCMIHLTFNLSSRKQGDVLRNANDALFHTMEMNEDRGCQALKNALVCLLSSYGMNSEDHYESDGSYGALTVYTTIQKSGVSKIF